LLAQGPVIGRARGGDDGHRHARHHRLLANDVQQFQPGHARDVEVQQKKVGWVDTRGDGLGGVFPINIVLEAVSHPLMLQSFIDQQHIGGVVFDQHNTEIAHRPSSAGRLKKKVAPAPSADSTQMSPPCA